MPVYAGDLSADCIIQISGRDVVFLDRMKDHAMTIFAGALVLNCLPAALHPVFGPVLSWVSGFMERRAMKRSMPLVKGRLEQTARWKDEPDAGWVPPVRFPAIIQRIFVFSEMKQLDI